MRRGRSCRFPRSLEGDLNASVGTVLDEIEDGVVLPIVVSKCAIAADHGKPPGTPPVTRLRPKPGSTLRLVTRVLGLPHGRRRS
jgi:hypothetical protein